MSLPVSTPPPANAPRRDYSFALLLGGIVLVAGLLMFTGIYFFARYIGKQVNFNVSGRGEQTSVEVQTPVGSVSGGAGRSPIAQLGIRVYPGSRPTSRQGQLSLSLPLSKSLQVVSAEFTTPDSADKVAAFYQRELGPAATVHKAGNETRIVLRTGGKQKYVGIQPSGPGADFVLANVTEAESN